MHDPFLLLPSPIQLFIIKLLSDFPSIHHFTQASPATNGIFEELPLEIMEALINRLPPDVAEIIQAFSESLPKSRTKNNGSESAQTQMPEHVYKPSLARRGRYSLPRDFTLSSVKYLLRVACRIHILATLFFEIYIKRVNAIRPIHLILPTHIFGVDPIVDYSEGCTSTPLRTGSASWVEELRVVRALWLLQYDTSLTPRAIDDARRSRTQWVLREMSCIQEFLIDNRLSLHSPHSNQPDSEASSQPACFKIACPPLHSSILVDPPTDPSSTAWQQDSEAAKAASPASTFFVNYEQRLAVSPIDNYSWQPFRRLGFDIWDLKRMCTLELMSFSKEVQGGRD